MHLQPSPPTNLYHTIHLLPTNQPHYSAAPPLAAPEPAGKPITYTFQGVIPPPNNANRNPKVAFDYPVGTPPTVAGSIRLAPALGVRLWRVAGATVVVNMTDVRVLCGVFVGQLYTPAVWLAAYMYLTEHALETLTYTPCLAGPYIST